MKSERTLFLADMHLRPGDHPDEHERLRAFLEEEASSADRLILLGDTFHCWYERGHHVVGDYEKVVTLFQEAAKRGLEIHHVSGNRDFILGAGDDYEGFYGKRIPDRSVLTDAGIQPHGLFYFFEQQGRKVCSVHGDILCSRDFAYLTFRGIFQGRIGQLLAAYLPFRIIKPIIRRIQDRPQTPRTGHLPTRKDIDPNAAATIIEAGADLLVCGHGHYDARHVIHTQGGRTGELVITPPWFEKGGFSEMLGDRLILHT